MKEFNLSVFRAVSFTSLLAVFLIVAPMPVEGSEDPNKSIRKTLMTRTNGICRSALENWFLSNRGMTDANVRALVTDCFMGHARLAVLGEVSGLSLQDLSLTEIPSALLAKESGMKLDPYRPLAGRVLETRQ